MTSGPAKIVTLSLYVRPDCEIEVRGTLDEVNDYVDDRRTSSIGTDALAWETIEALAKILRENRMSNERLPDEFVILGCNLWAILFGQNEVGKLLLKALQAKEQFDLLRVELEFAEPLKRVASWPWEYLYIPRETNVPGAGDFLAGRVSLVLTRRLSMPGVRSLAIDAKLKVLFVAASPNDKDAVAYEKTLEVLEKLAAEGKIVLNALVDAPNTVGKLDVSGGDWSANASKIKFTNALEVFGPHVVHFIGHGESTDVSRIAFVGSDGNADWLREDELRLYNVDSVRLVFLQACESALALADPYHTMCGFALHVAKDGIPAVVGMQYRVRNAVAEKFAGAFYGALANHQPVDMAVKIGRQAILNLMGAGRPFGLPVLYYNDRVKSGDGGVLLPAPKLDGQGTDRTPTASAPGPTR